LKTLRDLVHLDMRWGGTLPSRLEGLGSVVSSPSKVWGKAPSAYDSFLFLSRDKTQNTQMDNIGNIIGVFHANYWGSSRQDKLQCQNMGGRAPRTHKIGSSARNVGQCTLQNADVYVVLMRFTFQSLFQFYFSFAERKSAGPSGLKFGNHK